LKLGLKKQLAALESDKMEKLGKQVLAVYQKNSGNKVETMNELSVSAHELKKFVNFGRKQKTKSKKKPPKAAAIQSIETEVAEGDQVEGEVTAQEDEQVMEERDDEGEDAENNVQAQEEQVDEEGAREVEGEHPQQEGEVETQNESSEDVEGRVVDVHVDEDNNVEIKSSDENDTPHKTENDENEQIGEEKHENIETEKELELDEEHSKEDQEEHSQKTEQKRDENETKTEGKRRKNK